MHIAAYKLPMKKFQFLSLMICAFVAVYLYVYGAHLFHPRGEAEDAIWSEVLASPQFSAFDKSEIKLRSWSHSGHRGDMAPTHQIELEVGSRKFEIEATAWKYMGEDWDAKVLSCGEI